jgi:hypothetical protein
MFTEDTTDEDSDSAHAALESIRARQAFEAQAIPKCREWREANPELIGPRGAHSVATCIPECFRPAPYCCSAYCDRCAGLRALDGVEPLLPNGWMH